jgi:hypothetical protein
MEIFHLLFAPKTFHNLYSRSPMDFILNTVDTFTLTDVVGEVKLPRCLTKHHDMEVCGEGEI